MCKIVKRNGSVEDFNIDKIITAANKAFFAVNEEMPDEVLNALRCIAPEEDGLKVEEIQDMIENILFETGCKDAYKNFTSYRANHALLREAREKTIFDSIINVEKNDTTRENANMNSDSPAGQACKVFSVTSKMFVNKYLLSKDVYQAVKDNIMHIHDADYYPTKSLTCLQHPLDRVLVNGFTAGHGQVRPAKRIETAAIVAAISMETIQNEMHGGQAIPAFDFYMAPYVRLTYEEEVEKLRKVMNDGKPDDFWNSIKNAKIKDYLTVDVNKEYPTKSKKRFIHIAINNTVSRVHQAMESFIHNSNNISSRGGNQVVFSSINYGTDTSAEGRCVMRELLLSTERGVGMGSTAIFPIQIWKLKKGVSRKPNDPNYDLYKLSQRVSARRYFPNYLNLDSTFNSSKEWKKSDPRRFEHEVATMGCRTRVFEDRFGEETSIGRGNLSFTTLNFPKLAVQVAIEDGFLKKVEGGYEFQETSTQDNEKRVKKFINKLKEYVKLTAKQLDERYQFQKKALAKQFPLLMSGMWNGSEKLDRNDEVGDIINHGTLGIGFIGLAEALIALTGKHHGESDESQKYGLKIIKEMKKEVDAMSLEYKHNYSVLGTPAEGLSGKFTVKDAKDFGVIKGITDKQYYTNSSHVPVYYKCTASHKAEVECPYHQLELGGHIFYVEADADITKNPSVIENVVEMACENNGGYISINHMQGRCNVCSYESNDPELVMGGKCPHCGCEHSWDMLQRVTGFLSSTTDRWNSGKLAELKDRVAHVK